jgi:hypothetical protein
LLGRFFFQRIFKAALLGIFNPFAVTIYSQE